jgi:hypothetical protein
MLSMPLAVDVLRVETALVTEVPLRDLAKGESRDVNTFDGVVAALDASARNP